MLLPLQLWWRTRPPPRWGGVDFIDTGVASRDEDRIYVGEGAAARAAAVLVDEAGTEVAWGGVYVHRVAGCSNG